MHCDRQNRSCFHVYGMFRFVCQMSAPIFHFGDLCLRVLGTDPVLVATLFAALPVDFGLVFQWQLTLRFSGGPRPAVGCPLQPRVRLHRWHAEVESSPGA